MNDIIRIMVAQFCGNPSRLHIMTGAKNITYNNDDNSFRFQFKNQLTNICTIKYERKSDTYIMEFGKKQGLNYKIIKTYKEVYCDQLAYIFEDTTGLYLSF